MIEITHELLYIEKKPNKNRVLVMKINPKVTL